MGGKKPLRRPLWPPTRATASNYYPLGLDGAGGAAKPLLRAPKKPAPLHGRLPAFSGAVDAFERARKCFLEWRYFFSIILSEFLKNRVALHLGNRVKAVKPELERYAGLVQQIKEKSEERKKLLAEKKKTQFYQIPKLHDFTRRITELTEEIEELKTEKNFLLRSLNCADDADISDVKKEIATLEIALKKLDEQEVKYATELEDAMKQYAELNAQVADMDAVELKDARLNIRPDRERSAADRIKAAYGEKYDPVMMHDSKRDVANLLNEETGARSVRNLLRQTQKMQQMQQRREPKRHERER